MKNTTIYVIITFFLTMIYFLTQQTLNDPPNFISEDLLSGLMGFKTFIEKPFWFFSLFIDIQYIDEHTVLFGFLTSLFVAIPLTYFFSSDREDEFDLYIKEQKPHVLTEYQYSDKGNKHNIFPTEKTEKFLDKIGMLKMTDLEKEIYYNISLYLPDEARDYFSYQVRKIKRVDRVSSPDTKGEVYAFIGFNSILGGKSIKRLFTNKSLCFKDDNVKDEFILATVMFKDSSFDCLWAEVWIKNKQLNRIVFKSNKDIDINKKYDYKCSSTKIWI